MSVNFFSAAELGNVAAYLSRGKYERDGDMASISAELAAYSVGNAATFCYRYHGETAKGHKAADILASAQERRNKGTVDASDARSVLSLLSYNGPEGEGLKTFKGSQAYAKAMISLLGRAYSKALREADDRKGVGHEQGFQDHT